MRCESWSLLLLLLVSLTAARCQGFDPSKSIANKGERCLYAVLSTLALHAGVPAAKIKGIMEQPPQDMTGAFVFLKERGVEFDYQLLKTSDRLPKLGELCRKNIGVGVCIQGVFNFHAVTVLEVGDEWVKYVDPNSSKRIDRMERKLFNQRWQGHVFIVHGPANEKPRRK